VEDRDNATHFKVSRVSQVIIKLIVAK